MSCHDTKIMAVTWKECSAKHIEELNSDPQNQDLFRNIPWKKVLLLVTNLYAYSSWIQGKEFTKHPYFPASVGTKVSSDSVT